MTAPTHLQVKPEDIAEFVIASGDPARTVQLTRLLRKAKLVNKNRGFITYSGHYNGKMVTLSTHGIGGPSAAIVFEELRMLGAKVIVRFGTTGALVGDLNMGDFVVPTGAMYADGSLGMYCCEGVSPALPNLQLTDRIVERCAAEKVTCRRGLVFSSDSFYAEDSSSLRTRINRGAVGVEMECATLFTLGRLRGFTSTALLIVSNDRVTGAGRQLASAEMLRPYVEKGGRILLDMLTANL